MFIIKKINLSSFNTDNVTDMSYMFSDCKSLRELNISNFNTNNVTNMSYMFSECNSLLELNLSNFNISNDVKTEGIFLGIENNNLTNIICSEEFRAKINKK